MNEQFSVVGKVNGLDMTALADTVGLIQDDFTKGLVDFRVKSKWQGQTRSRTVVDGYTIGGEQVDRKFVVDIDEPHELLGENTAPNPQEMLMSAINACMMVGYVAGASTRGITLESLEIETDGQLDLRGFLGLDATIRPGYETLRYTVRIKGDGTPEQFQQIHESVMATSPNYFNITRPIKMDATLDLL